MEAALSSETLASNHYATRRNIPEDHELYLHRRANLKRRDRNFTFQYKYSNVRGF
jgi:hypothetical protein